MYTYLVAAQAKVQIPHEAMRMGMTMDGLKRFAAMVHGMFITEYGT